MITIRRSSLTLLFLLVATYLHAATLSVCNAGCTYNRTQLQTALDAAAPGDVILLEQNFTFVGDFIIPNQKTCVAGDATCMITVRTGVTATGAAVPDSDFPSADVRMDPSYTLKLAKVQPSSNSGAAFRTTYPAEVRTNCAGPPCVSKWWTFKWLEIKANTYGGFALLYLGNNDVAGSLPSGNTQDTLAEVPGQIIVDQCYVHGDPVTGQKYGISINSDTTQVINTWVSDIKMVGQDTSAINWWNTPGNSTIRNDYLEAAGENIIAGGTDIRLTQTRTLSASTTTTLTLSSPPVDLAINQHIACQVGGAAQSNIRGSQVTNIVGSVVTVSPAFAVACDVPGLAEWNQVPKTVSFTKTWLAKNANWRNPITPMPQQVQASTSLTGGTFAAGTYYYKVVAKTNVGSLQIARSTPSAEVSVTTTGTTSSTTVTWNPVPNASYYHVFGRSSGGETFRMYLVASDASCLANGGLGPCSVTDTNATTSGTCGTETANGCTQNVPTSTGTVWQEKNIFELKNADTWTIDGVVMDYAWTAAQTGYAVSFTVVNQDLGNFGNTVSNIIFRNSKVRHSNGGIVIAGTPSAGGYAQKSHDITISNIVFEDIGQNWNSGGGTERLILFSNGPYPANDGPDNVTISHITGFHTGGPSAFTFGDTYCNGCGLNNLVVKDSMFRKQFYATIFGPFGEGNLTWNADTKGTSVWTKIVNVGANCTLYPSPSTNYCPNESAWDAEFVDFANGNFRLKPTSTYHNAATDGTDIGANIDTIEALTNIALNGNNSGQAPPPPVPSITTSSPLPQGALNATYALCLTATGGTPPFGWTRTAGLEPTGLTLNSAGCFPGTATVASTFTFTATVTDALGQSANKEFALTIVQPLFPEPRPDKLFYSEAIQFRRNTAPDLVDQVRVGDLWSDLTTNQLKIATATSPAVTWTTVSGGGGGSVSSVALASPSELTVTGSPVTTSGTLTQAWTSQTQNKVFASPNGSTGTPLFRALVAADLPSTGTAFVQSGNAFGATAVLGTTDTNNLQIRTNNITQATFTQGAAPSVIINPDNNDAAKLEVTLANNTDAYSLGFSTAGRKIYLATLTGAGRSVMGLADNVATTDYIWGVSRSNDTGASYQPWLRVRFDGWVGLQNAPVLANITPTISSGFGTSATIDSNNGTATFRVNVGTGGTATSGVVGLPAAANGWNCLVNDQTSAAAHTADRMTRVTASTTTTVTVENQIVSTGATAGAAWAASDILVFHCLAY